MQQMQGIVAVVTGAASGIGQAIAAEMVGHGATVIMADINRAGLTQRQQELGERALAVEADLSTPEGIDAVAQAAEEAGGSDVLINNAGLMDYFLPIGEMDDQTWERVMAINVTAPMQLTRALLPAMLERGKGAIVNISSVAGVTGGAAGVAYTTSKHALIGMTRNTAFFYGPQGVRSNAICPAGVETGIADGGATPRVDWAWERVQSGFSRAGRMAKPEEISALVTYLVSDVAVNINGAVISTDGGWTAA